MELKLIVHKRNNEKKCLYENHDSRKAAIEAFKDALEGIKYIIVSESSLYKLDGSVIIDVKCHSISPIKKITGTIKNKQNRVPNLEYFYNAVLGIPWKEKTPKIDCGYPISETLKF